MNEKPKYKLQDLIDIEQFQTLQDRLNEIYSFPSSIIDNDGNILTATAWQDVCTKFHRMNPECEKECKKSDRYILSHLAEANPAVSYRCPHGLVDNATPIIIDGVHYGNFFTGQFFLEPPDLEFFRGQARRYGFEEEAYLEAVQRVPVWSQKQLESYLFFIKGLIEVISSSGQKGLKEIEARKQSEETDKRAGAILSQMMDGFCVTNSKNSRIVDVNEAMCRLTGYTRDELLHMSIADVEAENTEKEIKRRIRQVVRDGAAHFESRFRRKDGSVYDVEVSLTYLPSMDMIFSFHRDITERKRAEEALRESEARLASTNQIMAGVLEHTHMLAVLLDDHFNFVWVNRAYANACGYKPDFFPGKNHFSLYPHSENQVIFQRVVETGEPFFIASKPFEFPDQPGRGVTYWDWSLIPVKDTTGRVTNLVFTLAEVTERVGAVEALRKSEARYRAVVENQNEFIVRWKPDGTRTFVNDAYLRCFGLTYEQATSTSFVPLVAEQDRQAIEKKIARLVSGAVLFETDVHQSLLPNGDLAWQEWTDTAILDEAGNLIEFQSVGRDITERKRVESELYESEARYRRLVEGSPDIVYTFSPKRGGIYYSPRVQEVLGYSPEYLYAHPFLWIESIHPEDRDRVENAQNLELGQPFDIEYRIQDAHGNWIWLRDRSISYQVKNEVLADGLATDITLRKLAETALRASEEKFHNFVEQASEGFSLVDEQGRVIEWNRACEQLTGLTYEQVGGKYFWDVQHLILPPEQKEPGAFERRKKLIQDALRTGSSPIFSTVFEAELIKPGGERRFFRQSIFPIKTSQGCQMGLVSYDITENKKAETYLRESEEKYRRLFEVESDAIFLYNNTTGEILDANASAASLYGYSREELLTMRKMELSAEPEEIQKAMLEPVSLVPLRNHRKKDGTIFPVEIATSELIWNGKPVRIAAIRDITERKRTEEALLHMSTHDILTGVFNRAFFETELERLEPSRRFPVSIFVGDLDNMKTVNDTQGHVTGDTLLKTVARILQETFRGEDIIARIGGDEFAILLPGIDEPTAQQVLARVQDRLNEYNGQHPELPIHLSLGASTSEQGALREAFILADQRMYADKAMRKARK